MKLITKLYKFQQESVEKLLRVKVGALYMEMGTGKTRTALELIQHRVQTGKISQVLWLCPCSCVRAMPELIGQHAEDFDYLIRFAGIESLSQSARLYAVLWHYIASAPTYLIIDESLLTKNSFALRTKHIIELSRKCEYKLILNGTPISRNELDLFAQWYILDWRILGYRSYYSFAANHVEFDPRVPGKIVRARNIDYLAEKIAPYTYECRKDDVVKLPLKTTTGYGFWLTDEQISHYNELSDALLDQVDEFRPETIYRLFHALQSITSGFAILTGYRSKLQRYRMYGPKDNPRIEALQRVLSSISGEQAIIYCRYTQEIEDISTIIGREATPFYGEMSQSSRHNSKAMFERCEAKYLVANKSCAQFGLNLQFCRNVIFYNNDWDWATRVQAEDRVHRIGQDRDVNIYDIFAHDTIDETVYRCLQKKESLSDHLKRRIREQNNQRDVVVNITRGLGG